MRRWIRYSRARDLDEFDRVLGADLDAAPATMTRVRRRRVRLLAPMHEQLEAREHRQRAFFFVRHAAQRKHVVRAGLDAGAFGLATVRVDARPHHARRKSTVCFWLHRAVPPSARDSRTGQVDVKLNRGLPPLKTARAR